MTNTSKWGDTYCPKPGTVQEVSCGICGAEMNVERDHCGATSFGEFMAGGNHKYDLFSCPHRLEQWHKKVDSLVREGNSSNCRRIHEMCLEEADEILLSQNKNPCQRNPDFEKYWDPPEPKPCKKFRLQNRYQDEWWEDTDLEFDDFTEAVATAHELCKNPIASGMVRVIQGGRILVTFPAGGYE
jgi:hypothetical protein